jgi:ABC-type phosphate/phosphonate transport system substrate-binding protein
MLMLASLPMYDITEIRSATDGFWAAIAASLSVDVALTRDSDWAAPWTSSDLLFSQTCGYPFTHRFAGQLTYLATPHYSADGCEGANYRSIIFARSLQPLEAFRHRTAAINTPDSMSGMLALKLVFETLGDLPFFSRTIETGSHVASLNAVSNHHADVCAIDCVTVALLRKHRPKVFENLVEIARSPSVPGLPYVTRAENLTELRKSIHAAAQTEHARALLINEVSVLPANAYQQILILEASLKTAGRSNTMPRPSSFS